ncbi:hypothetical protein LPJ74_004424 [Coemansia sp. RSA 1843]|nr:hypothetical protein LPJ74_004424 [Coemansia sp. RSA 1843]
MTTSKGLETDIPRIHHVEESAIAAEVCPGSDLVDKFIAYYSTTSNNPIAAVSDALSHQGLFAPATPASSTSTESTTVSDTLQMRPRKANDSSGQSTDSEVTGNSRSSESSSSMGDSAAAAARVLAALQDRTGVSASSEAVGSASASVAEVSNLWKPVQTSATKIQSSTSTPRQSHSTFDANAREGSAPLPGSFDSSAQRRPDMGFLALLNSAAAYVAESSSTANPTVTAHHNNNSSNSTHSYHGHIGHDGSSSHHNRNRQQNVENSAYLAHSELLSANPLTLSGINHGFNNVTGGSSNGQSGFPAHYDPSLSNAAYRDLAQALQHIAATTTDSNSALLSSSSSSGVETQGHQQSQFGPQSFGSSTGQIGHLTASVIHQDHIMLQSDQYSALPHHENSVSGAAKSGSAIAPPGLTSTSKRKRKNGSSDSPFQTPAKRKSSHASDQSKLATLSEVRRAARKWTDEETENLLQGCSKYGVGAWKKILDDPSFIFNSRTSVDLKDRFRTIRAQECAHGPNKKNNRKSSGKEPDVVWPLPPNSQRLQGLHRVQRKPTRNYTNDEDRRLLIGVMRHANHWTKIAADPDLQLENRPGQSLRDRLRNAFPEVFEMFGYVIPNKERADRERHTTPGPPPTQSKNLTPKRKAPTASKRLDGDIPDHIRDKIMAILHQRNDSLDPHPIPENDVDPSYDADADGNGKASPEDDSAEAEDDDSGLSAMSVSYAPPGSSKSRTPKRRSTAGGVARASNVDNVGKSKNRRATASLTEAGDEASSKSKKTGGRRKSTTQKRGRSRSKAATAVGEDQAAIALASNRDPVLGSVGLEYEASTGYATTVAQNDGGIHSAPAHGANDRGVHIGEFSALSDSEQRRPGTISASSFGAQNHRNFLLESFAPSVFSRPIGAATPTDHLDALALEGRVASGYSTPTQSTKRRHSVQADINDAMAAAAAMAAGIDRTNFSSSMGYFNTSVAGLGHSAADVSNSTDMHLGSTADTIRRMTVDGQINPDAFLFPRLPDENVAAAAAAAAAAVAADMSTQNSSGITGAGITSAQTGIQATTADAMAAGAHNDISVSTDLGYKLSTTSATAEPSLSASATMNGAMGDIRGDLLMGHRSQLRSAQRLLRANGVADDNSIGLSTTSSGDTPVDLEALTHFSQWFPSFASSNLGWNLNDSAGHHISGDSIDPNMLNASIGTSATMGTSANGDHVADGSSGVGGGSDSNATVSGNGMTHARRRSQFDWYGLTPSLAATLDAANITAAAAAAQAAAPDTSSITSLNPFGIGQSTANASYRRPSMPIYPSFAYPPGSGDILGLQTTALHNNSSNTDIRSAMGASQGTVYNTASQDGAGIAEAAAAAAAAVAVALGDGSESSDQRAPAAGARSLSLSTGSEARAVAADAAVAGGSSSDNAHSRRRTMHVPSSLMEGVATSNFGNSLLNRVPAIPPSNGSGGSSIHALNLQTRHYPQHMLTGERNGTNGYPPRPSSGTLKPVDSRATRVRRSRTISNQNYGGVGGGHGTMVGVGGGQQQQQQQQRIGGAGNGTMQTLPAVSEATAAQLMQFPHVSEATRDYQQDIPQQQSQQAASMFGSLGIGSAGLGASGANSGGTRHARTLSGTQLTQEAMGALTDASSGLLSSFRLHDEPLDFGLAGHTASSQQYQQVKAAGAGSNKDGGGDSMDVDLEAMTTLSAGCAGSIDFSSSTFKPYLWTGLGEDGGLNGAATAVEETRSLVDVRRDADSGAVDLYRPASSTPTGGRRYLGIGGSSNAVSESTPTISPVAPRSAASTPGRREAVEI